MQRFEGVIKAPWEEKNWLDSGTQQPPLYLEYTEWRGENKAKKSSSKQGSM